MTGISNIRSGMQRVREGSNTESRAKGFWDICCSCCGSAFCSCCYLLLAAWPIALIVVGSIDLHNCRINRLIPVWMIVYGVVSLAMTGVSVVKQCICRQKKEEQEEGQRQNKGRQSSNCLEGMLVTFLVIWVFIGSSWVFGNYSEWQAAGSQSCLMPPNITTPSGLCCEPRTFLFALGSLLSIYSLFFLCCVLVCMVFCIGGACVVLGSSDE